MTKSDIVKAIQSENGFSVQKSSDITETLIEIIKSTLASGEDVLISGLGKFQVQEEERLGRNPATCQSIALPSRKVSRLGALEY